jgi:hypothetical protein
MSQQAGLAAGKRGAPALEAASDARAADAAAAARDQQRATDPGTSADTAQLLRSVLEALARHGNDGDYDGDRRQLEDRDLAAMRGLVDRLSGILREHSDRDTGSGGSSDRPRRGNAASPSSVMPAARPQSSTPNSAAEAPAHALPSSAGAPSAGNASAGSPVCAEDCAQPKRARTSRWAPATDLATSPVPDPIPRTQAAFAELSSSSSVAAPLTAVEEEVIRRSGWPRQLFADPERQPRVMHSAEEFMHELKFG